ncbi:Thermolabile hemolysin [Smittium culicis]|uniref:Thermolabile hemolysin n=1 Tax=Smittium culicis TaxID=133412 RepID=A0A1R1Y8H1_9FUNG|nr:Thermolabile hemolysin [Smittium culicis]
MMVKYFILSVFSISSVYASLPSLIIFGDSLSSNGNNEVQEGHSYYGKRLTNGPVWNEYAAYYSNYTVINYSYAGAATDNQYIYDITKTKVTIPSLRDQIEKFNNTFNGKLDKNAIKNDIVGITVGSNDIYYLKDKILKDPGLFLNTVSKVVDNLVKNISTLADMGYSRFIVSNFPKAAEIPLLSTASGFRKLLLNVGATALNNYHSSKISAITKSKKLASMYILNLYGIQSTLRENPSLLKSIGVTDLGSACYNPYNIYKLKPSCSDPRKFYFIDDIHPTTIIHAILGRIASDLINGRKFALDTGYLKYVISDINNKKIYTSNPENNYLDPGLTEITNKLTYDIEDVENNLDELISQKNSPDY